MFSFLECTELQSEVFEKELSDETNNADIQY